MSHEGYSGRRNTGTILGNLKNSYPHDLRDMNRETLGFELGTRVCDCAPVMAIVGGRRSTTDWRIEMAGVDTGAGAGAGLSSEDSIPIDDENGDVVAADVGVATAVEVDDIVDVGETWAPSKAVRGGINDGESTIIPGICS